MNHQKPAHIRERPLSSTGSIGIRTLAMLLMFVGALGFIVSLIAFGENILLLVISTLVVFGGLSINILARGFPQQQTPSDKSYYQTQKKVRNNSNFFKPKNHQIPPQSPAPSKWSTNVRQHKDGEPPIEALITENSNLHLIDRTSSLFRRQGAVVEINVVRDKRGLLTVSIPGSLKYTVMVDEGFETIQLGDIRALLSIQKNEQSNGAILITSQKPANLANEWALNHSIIIVTEDQLDQFQLPLS